MHFYFVGDTLFYPCERGIIFEIERFGVLSPIVLE